MVKLLPLSVIYDYNQSSSSGCETVPDYSYRHRNSVATNNRLSRSEREVKSVSQQISNQSFKKELT